MECMIKRGDEEYRLELADNGRTATVTDERDVKVTIGYGSGQFNVRLPNGWGYWVPSMEQAVERAVRLSQESKSQLTEAAAREQMTKYIEECKPSD